MTEENLIITNDLYLAAYLLAEGCELRQCGRNSRKRISFVIAGDRVQELRQQYRTGTVPLNVKRYRDSIRNIRNIMDNIHRSNICLEQFLPPDSTDLQ